MAIAGIIGTAVSLAGAVIGYSAQQKMINQQAAASKKAENSREQQMQLDASHRRRQAVRESIIARATALSIGTSQGAGEGSGVAGAMGNAISMGVENVKTTNATEILGSRVFDANREYFEATRKGQAGMALGQGLQSLGGALVSNAGTIQQIGTYFGNRPAGATLDRTV